METALRRDRSELTRDISEPGDASDCMALAQTSVSDTLAAADMMLMGALLNAWRAAGSNARTKRQSWVRLAAFAALAPTRPSRTSSGFCEKNWRARRDSN